MSDWKAKRFWEQTSVAPQGDGWEVLLDGRRVKTPAKTDLILPTRDMAEAIAAEWQAQAKEIDPASMPVTRAANSALDKVRVQHAEVAALIADYGASDLLCYRAVSPDSLIAAQAALWDPLLDWAEARFDARLTVTAGVMPVAQPPAAVQALTAQVTRMGPFGLTGFSDLVALSGSLVIGLAAIHKVQPLKALWDAARVDENWQAQQWGEDAEAAQLAQKKQGEFEAAAAFFDLSGESV